MELQDFASLDDWVNYKRERAAKDERIELLTSQYERAQKEADQLLTWVMLLPKLYLFLYVITIIILSFT